jgi:hypothetical protein
MKIFILRLLFFGLCMQNLLAQIDPDLFISEYIEGSSSNKAIEIYNGTDADVDLSAYSVQGTNNGTAWGDGGDRDFALTGTLAAGDVYVIAATDANPEILAIADTALAYESPVHHNGDDGIALLKDGVHIDNIGVDGVDPGDGWDVAGISNATKDHTLIRKSDITIGNTDWSASAGTNAGNSEWIVWEQDSFGSIGSHPSSIYPVTFSVDMNFQITLGNFEVGTDVVNVAGTLNAWNNSPLSDTDADGIYERSFGILAGPVEYKFNINGAISENIPDRTHTVLEGNNILPTVWYEDQEPVPPRNMEVFSRVDMTIQILNGIFDTGRGDQIVVLGDADGFGNWVNYVSMVLNPEYTNTYSVLSNFDSLGFGTTICKSSK